MSKRFASCFAVCALFAGGPAWADPLVQPGPKPGAITAWRTEGNAVVLTVDDAFDPEEVAQILSENLEGIATRVDNDRVMVTGAPQAALLKAMTKFQVEPLTDDVDAMLQAIKEGGERSEGSGSSLRAHKDATLADGSVQAPTRIRGTVQDVKHRRFPRVLITLRVDEVLDKSPFKKGQLMVIAPRVQLADGRLTPQGAQSRENVGAWYALPGDRVDVTIGDKRRRFYWADKYRRNRNAKTR